MWHLHEPSFAASPGVKAVSDAVNRQLAVQVRELVASLLPEDATVLVVSKGDEELVRLSCRAWHFPRDPRGGYAGYYPADGAAAVADLEALRAEGADYWLLPSTAFWWLDHYKELRDHLHSHYRVVTAQEHVCLIFAPRGAPGVAPGRARRGAETNNRNQEAV
jgi:hypothetical protein